MRTCSGPLCTRSDFFLLFLWKNDFLCNEVCWTMLKSVVHVYTVIPGYVDIRYTSSVLDCGLEPCSGQIKEYKMGTKCICCFSTKQVGQVHFVLDQHAELDFIVLAHWNNSLQVDISLNWTHYSDSEPTCLVEKQQIHPMSMYYKYYYQQVKVAIFRFLPFVFMKKWFSVQWGLLNNVEKCCIYSHTWLCQYQIHLECSTLDCGFEPFSGQIKEY
jgi:hypothetical protein